MSHLILMIDTSASTHFYKDRYIRAGNGIIDAHGLGHTTCVLFSNQIKVLCSKIPTENARSLLNWKTFQSEGLTSFYDCLAKVIDSTTDDWNDSVYVIVTDGQDTSSRYVSPKQLAERICFAKSKGARFLYACIDESSISEGRQLGFDVCILYSVLDSSLFKMPEVVKNILGNRQISDVDLDIREITQGIASAKI